MPESDKMSQSDVNIMRKQAEQVLRLFFATHSAKKWCALLRQGDGQDGHHLHLESAVA